VKSPDETFDDTIDTAAGAGPAGPVLFIVLEADRPLGRGARYSLVGVDTVTIGRAPPGAKRPGILRSSDGRSVHVSVASPRMSSSHLRICAAGDTWIAEDLGSRNGTFVDGARVTSAAVRDGSVIEAGRVFFMVRGAPVAHGPLLRDEAAPTAGQPFGLRTLLPTLHDQLAALLRIAQSTVPILILGETGSGKEVVAREVHACSGRGGPFIPVNCGAVPATLVESLLFGHVRGAFSGAVRDEAGFVRSADGGTLFLDEVADLPLSSQPALLRVLQEQEVVPVGAARPTKVDVRIVAATHRSLEASLEACEAGGFRSDLLARLKGYTHRLLPLRERREDLGVVLADILERVAGERAERLRLAPAAARALLACDWPFNIRGLEQAIAAATALADEEIDAHHLPLELIAPSQRPAAPVPIDALRDRLVALLYGHRGNVAAVSRVLGKAPVQIHRWMRRYSIDAGMYRRRTYGGQPAWALKS
jgi:transcriptional regulator of acetoin/glycerol metabolism